MFSKGSTEEIIKSQEKRIQELQIQIESLRRYVDKLYKEVGISPAELDAVLQKSENFSPEEWSEVMRLKGEIESRINSAMGGVSDPRKAANTRESLRGHQNHWIFVR